jgi:signal transduction histidine kinase/ActR/RegA family two-component response regulator
MLRSLFFPLMVWGLTLCIFLLDALTPLSIAVAVLYGAVILLASSKWSPRAIVALSFTCLSLTLIAYGLGHRLDFFGEAFGRCTVSLSAIIINAILALKGQAATTALRNREEALRVADRQKDEFLAMLAHELRNPIAPISGAAYLLKTSCPENEEVQEATDIVIRQSDHLSALVDDLLDVSRVTRRLAVLEKKEVDMKRVVAEAVEQIRPLIDAAAHKFVSQLPTAPAVVLGDHKRLVQVVANLLNNAAKYTPEGGTITLQMTLSGELVKLTITDSGIGISSDLLPHVFELFTQAERNPDRTQGGLGVGLALVKNLVQLHGGTVEASSSGNFKGSTFTINLPSVATIAPPPLAENACSVATSVVPLQILVVDDNTDVAKILAKFLLVAGHQAVAVSSAKDALEMATRRSFDVYFLDIGLPEIDGNALALRLRTMPSAKDALIIAVTGYGQKFDRQKSLDSGFDHYFVKPVNPISLVALLESWQSERHVAEVAFNEYPTNA